MVPSRKWFPTSLQERAAWYNNFAAKFSSVATGLGFTAADVTAVENDNELVQYLAATTVQIEAFVEAFRQYRITVTEGRVGDPTPAYPANPTGSGVGAIPTGVFERLVRLVERIRASPAYTPETGALLGIIPKPNGGGTPEVELKPAVRTHGSFMNYQFSVNVTRLGQPLFKVQYQKQGQGSWIDAVTTNQNPATVTINPTTAGQPERVLVRAMLMRGEQVVGVPSDPTFVTVNP